jgi:Lysophospholipase
MTDASTAAGSRLTVALVHGAFADSAGWNDVIEQLQAAGIAVQAISNPLRGITADAAYVASAIRQIPGPVLAVGHSYGGAIITNAAPQPATSSAWSTSPPSPQMKARPSRTSKATPRTAS